VTSSGGTNGSGVVFRLTFPALIISNVGNLAILSWPTNQVGFSLQTTTDLANPAWSLATTVPVVVGNQFVVTNVPSGSRTYYRLIK
jgi:hypothetical protein